MKGSIVIDEFIVPITDISLAHGGIQIQAVVKGPVRAVSSTDYVVHDRSGAVVFRSVGRSEPIWWPEMSAGSDIIVTAWLTVDNHESRSGPPR